MQIIPRFFKFVKKSKNCWLWTGGGTRYGVFSIKDISYSSHRISWQIHFGEIPKGMVVCHKCDIPKCVNPKHLFLGTQMDNIKDKISKGHQKRGEKLWNSKLTLRQVKRIRKEVANRKHKQVYFAKLYSVDPTTIRDIVHFKSWKINSF